MTEHDNPALTNRLARLRLHLAEPVDLTRTGPDITVTKSVLHNPPVVDDSTKSAFQNRLETW